VSSKDGLVAATLTVDSFNEAHFWIVGVFWGWEERMTGSEEVFCLYKY
jgi:hypothetical protein